MSLKAKKKRGKGIIPNPLQNGNGETINNNDNILRD